VNIRDTFVSGLAVSLADGPGAGVLEVEPAWVDVGVAEILTPGGVSFGRLPQAELAIRKSRTREERRTALRSPLRS